MHDTPDPAQLLIIARERIAYLETELCRQQDKSELLKTIFDQTPNIAMVVDRNGRILDINRSGQQFIGHTREQILNLLGGEVFRCLNALTAQGCGHTQECHVCPIRSRVHQTFDTGIPIHLEEGRLSVQQGKAKRPVDFLISTVPVLVDGAKLVLVTLVDITERKQLEEERELIFQLSQDLICVAGMDGYFRQLNPAWEQCLGWTMADLLAHPWLDFVHEEDREATIEAGEKLRAGERLTDFVNRYRCKDGGWRWLAWNAVPEQQGDRIFSMVRDVTEQQRISADLNRLATTDPLTGLLNRRSFLERAEGELNRFQRYQQGFAMLMLDLDRFKAINDTHGHAAGDSVLQSLGDLLRRSLRETDCCGRLGGEEFALLLPGATRDTACALAERVLGGLRRLVITAGDASLQVTASIGLTTILPGDQSLDAILVRADQALYRAKEAGRDRVALG